MDANDTNQEPGTSLKKKKNLIIDPVRLMFKLNQIFLKNPKVKYTHALQKRKHSQWKRQVDMLLQLEKSVQNREGHRGKVSSVKMFETIKITIKIKVQKNTISSNIPKLQKLFQQYFFQFV